MAITILLFMLAAVLLIPLAATNANAIDKTTNHYKYCIKLKDKKTRSIICPDVFPSSETNFVPGG